MPIATTSVAEIVSLLADRSGPGPVLLYGAGASMKSGIPLSADLTERAAKWAYCRQHGKHQGDPTVMRSDWLAWLRECTWFRADKSMADNYPAAVENLLVPREARKDFLTLQIHPGVPASDGYERLADLVAQRVILTLLTTNFDEVLPNVLNQRTRPHHVAILKTPYDYVQFSTSPRDGQIIYVHGSVEHYSDKNLTDEIQELDRALVTHLVPILRDHPLIVVGYRGSEPSVMKHLLLNHSAATGSFRHGIFWCLMKSEVDGPHNENLRNLASSVGSNFRFVPIDGFDSFMAELHAGVARMPQTNPQHLATTKVAQGPAFRGADMIPVQGATFDNLDRARLANVIRDYCASMGLPTTQTPTAEWLQGKALDLDIACQSSGEFTPTRAGYLMFAAKQVDRINGARTVVRIAGEPDQELTSNLWSQFESLQALFVEYNKPFRLKGTVSETVFPYPELAIKELLVNALVHRDYGSASPATVEITPTYIRITSPGGLVPEVQEALKNMGSDLQTRIFEGGRGLKGYRNPVLADVFYGTGAMDKKGSGLADVHALAVKNNCSVRFGPSDDNSRFEVLLSARPEASEVLGGTAASAEPTDRYTTNLLEVQLLPEHIYHAECPFRNAKELYSQLRGISTPPFLLKDGRLWTFDNLADGSVLASVVEAGTVESLSTDEWREYDQGHQLIELLHYALYNHLFHLGLIVDKRLKRAYFPREEDGAREISYRATLKRAKRTVTKPYVRNDVVRHWEHEAFRFAFRQLAGDIALQVLPCYVFTRDGEARLLEGPRVGPLSTRKAARDFNSQVRNDVVFWSWVLSGGLSSWELALGSSVSATLSAAPATAETRGFPVPEPEGELTLDPDIEEELSRVDDELAEIAEALEAEEASNAH